MKKLISLFAIIVLSLILIKGINPTNVGINPPEPVNCYTNSDCTDINFQTLDACINPGTTESYCSHTDINISCPPDNDCENNSPLVFKCGNTTYLDDNTEPGRVSEGSQDLVERKGKYLFEGEKIYWKVLVVDFNGIDNIEDVYGILSDASGHQNNNRNICLNYGQSIPNENIKFFTCKSDLCKVCVNGNNYPIHPGYCNGDEECHPLNEENQNISLPQDWTIEVNCIPLSETTSPDSCNLREYQNEITGFNSSIMKYYNCVLTVETSESMYGKKWITVEAYDIYGNSGIMPEAEQWFLNPVIAISVNDSISFKQLKPGQTSYSNDVLISNAADLGSEVILDMFISGTDFSSSNPDDYCPNKQTLPLSKFRYYAEKGDFNTTYLSNSDFEGYRPLIFGIGFNNPDPFYNLNEIIPKNNDPILPMYFLANQIGPNENIKLKFKINVPEQCSGEFNSGNIYVWGEAI